MLGRVPDPALVARLRAAGCVFAEDEAALLEESAGSAAELSTMVDRRVTGEPLEHVLGWAEFCGLRIQVDPGVFRPRPRTEFLVEHAAELVRSARAGRPAGAGADADRRRTVVVDLCCGSGALGVALATMLGSAELHAADVDPMAVACARRNVEPLGGQVHEGDLFEPLPAGLRGGVDVLLANVPYVPTADLDLMPAEARLHEPVATLDGGPDGLDVLRRVSAEASRWLAPGGHLLTEASARQAEAAAGLLRSAGLPSTVVTSEEHDATVVVGSAVARCLS
jgi:release factor glutamine methyltransferase